MPKPRKPPTVKSVARHIAALHLELSRVYATLGSYELQRTTEHGTLTLTWKSGREVLEEKPDAYAKNA